MTISDDNLAMSQAPRGYRFATVVWGTDYVDAFLRYSLPSQLAPNNLPCFHGFDASYRIYTTRRDAEVIAASAAYRELYKWMPVEFELCEDLGADQQSGMKYGYVLRSQTHLFRNHRRQDVAFLCLYPDAIWADGSLLTLLRAAQEGKRLALAVTLHARRQTLFPALAERCPEQNAVFTIAPRALMRLGFAHLHPGAQAALQGAKCAYDWPSTVLWPLGDDGLLLRPFHLQPILLRPHDQDKDWIPRESLDYDCVPHQSYAPDEVLLCILDFDPNEVTANAPLAEPQRIRAVAEWAVRYTTARQRNFFRHRFYLHAGDRSPAWTETENQSDRFVDAVLSLVDELDPLDLQIDRGHAAAAAGRWPEALSVYFAVVSRAPSFGRVYVPLAGAAMALGNFAIAKEALTVALGFRPTDPELLCGLGAIQLGLGDRAAADVAFRRALAVQPDHENAQLGLEALTNEGTHSSGDEQALLQALAIDLENFRVWLALAQKRFP